MIDVSVQENNCFVLLDLDGPVATADERFGELGAQLGTPIERVYHLGGYAETVVPSNAAPTA
ncbi:MAG: hypothetical protein WDN69_04260 [Aliidongia sp.]